MQAEGTVSALKYYYNWNVSHTF